MSVPAHAPGSTPAHRDTPPGVTHPDLKRDHVALITAAASNPGISDRALRVYVVAITFDRGVTATQVAAALPDVTETQAARLLGDLVSAGLLRKRLRTIGYKEGGLRRRQGFYTLVGGES